MGRGLSWPYGSGVEAYPDHAVEPPLLCTTSCLATKQKMGLDTIAHEFRMCLHREFRDYKSIVLPSEQKQHYTIRIQDWEMRDRASVMSRW